MKIFQNLSIKNKLIVLVLSVALTVIGLGFGFIVVSNIQTWKDDMIRTTSTTAQFLVDACSTPLSFGAGYYDEVQTEMKKLDLQPIIENGFIYDTKGKVVARYLKNDGSGFTPPPNPKIMEENIGFVGEYLHLYKPIIMKQPQNFEDSGSQEDDQKVEEVGDQAKKKTESQSGTPESDEPSVEEQGPIVPGAGERLGVLYIRASTAELTEKIRSYLRNMGIALIGLIILTYLLAARLQRMISRPILILAGVTRDITEKTDYSVRVAKEGEDEIGILYTGFNNMLEQIQLREEQRNRAEAEQSRLNEELIETNEELEHLMSELTEKNKELEQVVYVTSHDLRSPLVNIQGFSKELGYSLEELSTLLKSKDIPEEIKEKCSFILEEDIPDSLRYILSSTSKMDSLLSGLLKLSRVGRAATTFANVDMNELIGEINNAFEFHLKESGVEFRVGSLPPCWGNDVELNKMFSNLVSNALKYLDPERPGKIVINGRQEKSHVIYSIQDNGLGIAEEHQKKVFEIFHRLNPDDTEGEGLGLTIVNKIVSLHNGKIWVESEPGKGSTFFISLPTVRKIKAEHQNTNNMHWA